MHLGQNVSLVDRITDVTKKLRKEYYHNSEKQIVLDDEPFGGSIRESIGPFPEFILKGRFCKRSGEGLCTPCFYSKLPEHDILSEDFNKGYLKQVDHIIQNFDKKFLVNQKGRVAFDEESNKPVYACVCTPTGSYFDDAEYPYGVRVANLKKLLGCAEKRGFELVLHIESHAEDVITYFKRGNNDEELELLKKLNVRVILGFESSNDFSRNIVYAKRLDIDVFIEAVRLLKEHNIPVGAFVFAGLFGYTESETIEDVTSTLLFLKEMSISPVLMFANTQKYTIPDVLYKNNRYSLVDPFTVLDIVRKTIDIFGCNMNSNIDPWFIADPKGGPPEPDINIFKSKDRISCDMCSDRIYNAIENLRITKNSEEFIREYEDIVKCPCRRKYEDIQKKMKSVESESITKRITKKLNFVEKHIFDYVLSENPSKIKSELLCYGINVSKYQKKLIYKYNRYVDEPGFVHAMHIIYDGMSINVSIADDFCKKSLYHIRHKKDNLWILYRGDYPLGHFKFVEMPDWTSKEINGVQIGKFIRPHSEKCLSCWPSLDCSYINEGQGCKFCSLQTNPFYGYRMKPELLYKMVDYVLSSNPDYELNFSGGTCISEDDAVKYFIELCGMIKSKYPKQKISIECAPPSSSSLLEQLKEAGATDIIMNLEIYDDPLRKEICPGKSRITRDHYLQMLSESVKIFGKGNVSSVLIVGIQPNDDVIKASDVLIGLGVIPTLIPFKPLDGSQYEIHDVVKSSDYYSVSKKVNQSMNKNCLKIPCDAGCVSCGACSLEIDFNGRSG